MNRTKNYIILDTETATLPFIREMELTSEQKKKIAIAKPLVYDIGWTIANRTYGIVERRNFLVAETFAVPQVFNTAYYAEKRPLYYEMIAKGEATVLPWDAIMEILIKDLENAAYICAYNAMFDFKKAIIFTEAYIRKVYSPYYHEWEENQKNLCAKIAYSKEKPSKNPDFDPMNFVFRGNKYPMIDIWGVACNTLLNCNKYKNRCLLEKRISPSGLYFSTNAETAMQYLSDNFNFIEDHTALSDAEIEKECFADPWSEDALRSELSNDNAIFLVSKTKGKVSGYIGVHTVLDESYIANVAVKGDFRRLGIGSMLLDCAEKKVKAKACSFISLEVRVSNTPAINLYQKHGYVSQGERKNFYSHPTENALIMTKTFSEE